MALTFCLLLFLLDVVRMLAHRNTHKKNCAKEEEVEKKIEPSLSLSRHTHRYSHRLHREANTVESVYCTHTNIAPFILPIRMKRFFSHSATKKN